MATILFYKDDKGVMHEYLPNIIGVCLCGKPIIAMASINLLDEELPIKYCNICQLHANSSLPLKDTFEKKEKIRFRVKEIYDE